MQQQSYASQKIIEKNFQNREAIPEGKGIYIKLNTKGKIIYIGQGILRERAVKNQKDFGFNFNIVFIFQRKKPILGTDELWYIETKLIKTKNRSDYKIHNKQTARIDNDLSFDKKQADKFYEWIVKRMNRSQYKIYDTDGTSYDRNIQKNYDKDIRELENVVNDNGGKLPKSRDPKYPRKIFRTIYKLKGSEKLLNDEQKSRLNQLDEGGNFFETGKERRVILVFCVTVIYHLSQIKKNQKISMNKKLRKL